MAAAEGAVRDLCDEVTCSICLDYFKDPVTIAECGHNFCRACLSQCLGETDTDASCPQCRRTFQQRSLITNRQLSNLVQIAKKLRDLGAEGNARLCEKHREPLKLFCTDHGTPICVVCDRSKEHENHKVVPVEEALQEDRDLISSCLELLWKEQRGILEYKAVREKESQDLLKQTKAEKEKAVAEFRRQQQFLKEQEKVLLTQVEEVEKEIARKREEVEAKLSMEFSFYESIIQKVEKSLQPAREVMQDVLNTFQRYEEERVTLEGPAIFPPALKWKIWDFCDINHILESVTKQLKDTLLSVPQPQKANITLDPDTAHPQLILSEDRKSVKLGEEVWGLPDTPERFDTQANVLGREGFTAGRHFWEVTIDNEEEWAVGVARKTVRRKGQITLIPEEGVVAMGKWEGDYQFSTPPNPLPPTLGKRFRRIQVSLNCAAGQVSFFDADRAALLYSEASFSGEVIHPFFWLGPKTKLRLSS